MRMAVLGRRLARHAHACRPSMHAAGYMEQQQACLGAVVGQDLARRGQQQAQRAHPAQQRQRLSHRKVGQPHCRNARAHHTRLAPACTSTSSAPVPTGCAALPPACMCRLGLARTPCTRKCSPARRGREQHADWPRPRRSKQQQVVGQPGQRREDWHRPIKSMQEQGARSAGGAYSRMAQPYKKHAGAGRQVCLGSTEKCAQGCAGGAGKEPHALAERLHRRHCIVRSVPHAQPRSRPRAEAALFGQRSSTSHNLWATLLPG